MPVKRGRLKPQDHEKIMKQYSYLLENIDPCDFVDHLIDSFVLTTDDLDEIKNVDPTTRRGRAERFLRILERAGEDAYERFIEALNESGNEHIAKELDSTVVEVQSGGAFSWIDSLPDEMKNQRVTDQQASRLSACFGRGWQHVFRELGVRDAKIQQTEETQRHSVSNAITNLLIYWRQREASKATFSALLKALQKADDRCTIDWDLVKSVVEEKT